MTINGSDMMLFVDSNGTKKSIAYATNHTLEVSADSKDISTKDNGGGLWSCSELGLMNWSTSSENLCSDTEENGLSFNDLFDIMLNRKKVEVAFALQSNIPDLDIKTETSFEAPSTGWTPDTTNYYKGNAYITSLSLTAQNGEKASYTCQLTGAGPLLKIGGGLTSSKKN